MFTGIHIDYPLFLSDFRKTKLFFGNFEKFSLRNFMKIFPVGAELFHADGQTHTDVMKLTVAFRNSANGRKKVICKT